MAALCRLGALWQDVATQIEYVNQEGYTLEDRNIPRQERGEQTVKETKTGWLDRETRFKGNAKREILGRSNPPTPQHMPSSASPVCLDTTEKLGVVNIFALIFFFSSAICNLQRDEWDESMHFIHSPRDCNPREFTVEQSPLLWSHQGTTITQPEGCSGLLLPRERPGWS